MKLSFIVEMLLIAILVAFAASATVGKHSRSGSRSRRSDKGLTKKFKSSSKRQNASNTPNRYCSCKMQLCNCCREFNLPVLSLKGPGCASLQYLQGDQLAISMSFNERVLTNTTIKGRKPQPVCMPLPGGISKFCGRVYNIGRQGDEFNACLGLELRACNDIEAAIRVSCFRFGPKGLRLEAPQPLPPIDEDNNDTDDDDDDDDDEEDDDEYDFDDSESDNDVEDDYETLSVIDDDFFGGYLQETESELPNKNKVTTSKPVRKVTTTKTTKKAPVRKQITTRKPIKKATTAKIVDVTQTTIKSLVEQSSTLPNITDIKNNEMSQTSTEINAVTIENSLITSSLDKKHQANQSLALDKPLENDAITKNPVTTEASSEETDEDDPLAEAVGGAIEDELSDESTEEVGTDSKVTTNKEESTEVFDEIVDGVVDTFTGEESESGERRIK